MQAFLLAYGYKLYSPYANFSIIVPMCPKFELNMLSIYYQYSIQLLPYAYETHFSLKKNFCKSFLL